MPFLREICTRARLSTCTTSRSETQLAVPMVYVVASYMHTLMAKAHCGGTVGPLPKARRCSHTGIYMLFQIPACA